MSEYLEGFVKPALTIDDLCRDAVRACDAYFRKCAEVWSTSGGQLMDNDGRPVVGGPEVEELCQIAGDKCSAAMEILEALEDDGQ